MTKFHFMSFFAFLTIFSCISEAKVYERCEFARELLKHGVPRWQVPTFVCIANFESHFNTVAMNPTTGDHGILQISQIYWCEANGGRGKACQTTCASFRDDFIGDDIACARRIHAEHQRLFGNGFNAWTVYRQYCLGNTQRWADGCF